MREANEPAAVTDIHPTTGAEKHAHFDLWLHTDESLEALIGRPITRRATIHEWPLSCVQRIDSEGGTLIYKSQCAPTLEPEFYARASSKLLPAHRYLEKLNGSHTMTFESIEGTRLADRPIDPPELLALGARLQDEIRQIDGELPVYTDIGSKERWLEFADGTLRALAQLIDRSVFPGAPREIVSELRDWATSPRVVHLIESDSGFCHGDLNGGNIFEVGDELRLVDWQRPRRGPRSVDLAALLIDKGHDASAHVPVEAVQMLFFLMVAWFVESQTTHIPQVNYELHVLGAASRLLSSDAGS